MNGSIVSEVLQKVWAALEPLGQPMAVMGGLALAIWKHVRATRDVDVLISLESTEEAAMRELLRRAGVRRQPSAADVRLGKLRLLRFICAVEDAALELEVDVLIAEGPYHKQALRRRIETTLLDTRVFVLTCEDVILHKLLAGRIIDRYDVAELLRRNSDTLDYAYLLSWAGDLGVLAELKELWGQGMADRPFPASDAASPVEKGTGESPDEPQASRPE
jgi:hypothetical protein